MEKSYLENQINFLKNQLEENKRLHDALLMALEQGLHHGESEATNELVETNRHLSAAVDKMEARCKMLEEKIEKAKRFKRMVKNSSALQCAHCSKFISTNIFLQHLSNCVSVSGAHQPTNHQQLFNGISSLPIHNGIGNFTGLNPLGSPYNTNNLAPSSHSSNFDNSSHFTQGNYSSLQIAINQTMVKESSDSKPYTEYLIQVVSNGTKWSVSRKYKMFCELHQTLTSAFPSLKFPDSNFTGMSSFINISQAATSKRPTVIEERRKALQQYLRDLSKIDVIRNSQPFRKFLELERANEQAETDKSRTMPVDFNLTRDTSTAGGERQNLTPMSHQEGQGVGTGIGRMSLYTNQKFEEEEKPKADKRGPTYSPAPITTNQHYDERASNNKENRNPRKSINDHQEVMHNKKYTEDEDEINHEQEANGWPEANENDFAGKAYMNQFKNDNIVSSQSENVVRSNKIGAFELPVNRGNHSRNSSNSMLNTDQGQSGGLYGAIASTLANSRSSNNTAGSRYTPESNKTLAQKNYRNLKNTAISNSPASPQKYLFKPSMERGGTFKEYQRENHSLNNSRNINNGSYTLKM